MDEKKAVVLLSGGRDSLLAACLSIEQGYSIVPVICNNGHMEGVEKTLWQPEGQQFDQMQYRYGLTFIYAIPLV